MSAGAPPGEPARAFRLAEGADEYVVAAPGVRLLVRRLGERWAHALDVGAAPEIPSAELARSVEGDPDGADASRVLSPAYQDVRSHPDGPGVCLLLTGQSTRHHFSAVVTAFADEDRLTIDFDVADRCRAPVDVLAATYLMALGSGELRDASPTRVVWGGGILGGGTLALAVEPPGVIALAEAGRRASRVQALAGLAASATHHTHRLRYRWSWTPPNDTAAPAVND